MVGIDGSEESMKAVEFAISMAKIYRAEQDPSYDIGYWIHIFLSGCRKSPFDNKGNYVVS